MLVNVKDLYIGTEVIIEGDKTPHFVERIISCVDNVHISLRNSKTEQVQIKKCSKNTKFNVVEPKFNQEKYISRLQLLSKLIEISKECDANEEYMISNSLAKVISDVMYLCIDHKEIKLILDAASKQVELDLKTPEYEAYPNIPGIELI